MSFLPVPTKTMDVSVTSAPQSTCSSDAGARNKDNVRVIVRVRPLNANENRKPESNSFSEHGRTCIDVTDNRSLLFDNKPEPKPFKFDYVADQSLSQESLFGDAALPIVDACLEGKNPDFLISNLIPKVITEPYSPMARLEQERRIQSRAPMSLILVPSTTEMLLLVSCRGLFNTFSSESRNRRSKRLVISIVLNSWSAPPTLKFTMNRSLIFLTPIVIISRLGRI